MSLERGHTRTPSNGMSSSIILGLPCTLFSPVLQALEARVMSLERGHNRTPSNGMSSSNGQGSTGDAAGPPTPCGESEWANH